MTDAQAAASVDRSRRPALWALCLAMFVPSFGASMVLTSFPTLMRTFEAPYAVVQWLSSAYLLATVGFTLLAGGLGDSYDRHGLLIASLALFLAASIACVAAPTLALLIACRVIQGTGAAGLLTLSFGLLDQVLPPSRRSVGVGLLHMSHAMGTMAGPALGGLVLSIFGWRSIFVMTAAIAFVALVMLSMVPRLVAPVSEKRFTVWPTIRWSVGLTCATLVAIRGPTHGLDAYTMVHGIVAVACLVPTRGSGRIHRPAAIVLVGLGANLVVLAAMTNTLIIGAFYMERGLGLSVVTVGLALGMGPLVSVTMGVPAGLMIERFGKPVMLAGTFGWFTLGMVALSLVAGNLILYLSAICVAALGYACFQTTLASTLLGLVPASRRASMGSYLSLSRNLGLIAGTSLIGAFFAANVEHASGTSVALSSAVAVTQGMHTTFRVVAVVCSIILLLILLVLRDCATSTSHD